MDNLNKHEAIVATDEKVSFMTMREVEKQHIYKALKLAGNNKTKAAKMLGFTLKTLYNKLNSYYDNEIKETIFKGEGHE